MNVQPLPAVSPELNAVEIAALKMLFFAFIRAKKKDVGVDECRKHVVGAARVHIGRALPPNVSVLGAAKSPEMATYLEAQRTAGEWLASVCAACGGCPWSER